MTGAWDRSNQSFTLAPENAIWADLKINNADTNPVIVPKGANNTDYVASWTSNSNEECSLFYAFNSHPWDGQSYGESTSTQVTVLPTNGNSVIKVFPFTNVQPGAPGGVSIYCPTSMIGSGVEGVALEYKEFYYDSIPTTAAASASVMDANIIKVVSTNDGRVVNWSEPNNILWTASADVESVSVALYRNSMFYRWIARDLPSRIKNYRWLPAQTISVSELGSNFQIDVVGLKPNPTVIIADKSDRSFSIVNSIVTSPIIPALTPDPIISAPAPIPTLTASAQPHNAVMAQDGSGLGWKLVAMTFSGDLGASWNTVSNYSVATTKSTPISVGSVSGYSTRPIVILSRNLEVGERVTVAHRPSNSSVCLGYLPVDVDGNGYALSADIGKLNAWVGTTEGAAQPLYTTDINRDGVFNAADVTKAGEILSTAGTARTLPACPSTSLGASPASNQTQMADALTSLTRLLQKLQLLLQSQ